ncbi:MAG: T9SS type A sorting domain-containing protein [Tenacibaculum sp.]
MIKKIPILVLISFVIYSQENYSIKELTTYPNPFSNQTEISFKSGKEQIVTLTVKNILGKTVFSKKITAKYGKNNYQFIRNDLNTGMYVYAIHTYKEQISKRFVIN